MKKIVLFVALVSSCFAVPQDLSGKVFVFPRETNTDNVKLLTTKTTFSSFTSCLRFLTDQARAYSLFSMATPARYNDIVIFKPDTGNRLAIHAYDKTVEFLSLPLTVNKWHSLCVTWESTNGLSQVWLDGKPSVKKFITSGSPISGKPITILGQEQDSYGGGFDAAQSFVGMTADVHMWDRLLPRTEIKSYMNHKHFTPGNVFNWRSLDYEITGKIYVDDAPDDM